MRIPDIHIVYEYSDLIRPHASSYIRLILPLVHPLLRDRLNVSFGFDFDNEKADAVFIDRLWRPDVTFDLAEELVGKIKHAKAKLIYALDDNFFELKESRQDWLTAERLKIIRFFLENADSVLVTTEALHDYLRVYNPNISVLTNQWDERLVSNLPQTGDRSIFNSRIKIGCMGTLSHDDDLLMIAPALNAVWENHVGMVEFELVGMINNPDTLLELKMPVKIMNPRPEETEYPLFCLWFTNQFKWDIALAPLSNIPFNRYKSDIKFLDYSAIGAAGIFSDLPAYSKIKHKENGWLVDASPDSWQAAIEELIINGDLRKKISRNAQSYFYSSRTICQNIDQYITTITKML